VFDPLDFLAEVSAQILDAHEKTRLFYAWYSNRTRRNHNQQGLLAKGEAAEPVPGPTDRVPLEARRAARLGSLRGLHLDHPTLSYKGTTHPPDHAHQGAPRPPRMAVDE